MRRVSKQQVQRIAFVTLVLAAGLGVLLRFRFYLADRAIWFDEALAALDAIEGGLERILPPHAVKIAPPGFLLVEKGLAATLGYAEWALRLYPFLGGLIALALFYVICRKALRPVEQPFVMLLFALSPELIFYGAELKPYATDVAFGLLLLHLGFRRLDRFDRRDLVLLTLVGCVAGWFSYASSLVLAAVSIVVFVHRVHRAGGPRFVEFSAAAGLMAANVYAIYEIAIRHWAESQWVKFWAPYHLRSEISLEALRANVSLVGSVIYHHFGLVDAPWTLTLFLLLFLLGLAIGSLRKDPYVIVAALLFVFALMMSLLRLNPIHERVVLYLVPFFLFGVAAAWRGLADAAARWPNARVAAIVAASLFWVWVAAIGGQRTYQEFVVGPHPLEEKGEDFRPFFYRLAQEHEPGEEIHVEFTADYVFNYYAYRFDFEAPHQVTWKVKQRQTPEAAKYIDEAVGPGRSWFVFAGRSPRTRGIRDAYLEAFEAKGKIESVIFANDGALVAFRKR